MGGILFLCFLCVLWGTMGLKMMADGESLSGIVSLAFAIGAGIFAYNLYKDKQKKNNNKHKSSKTEQDTDDNCFIRSNWEIGITEYVKKNNIDLEIKTNDRSIIPSRYGGSNLEIDIWIPEIKLGIETNGTYFHNREEYQKDKYNGTEYTKEMYKENYCKRRGITLLHVWDSDSDYSVHKQIDEAIARCKREKNLY